MDSCVYVRACVDAYGCMCVSVSETYFFLCVVSACVSAVSSRGFFLNID